MTDDQAQAEVAWADERARKYGACTRFGQMLVKTIGLVTVVITLPARDAVAAVVAAFIK
jgi:hypothetical protein